MSSQKRRHWKAEEKYQMIAEARQTDSTVSEVCRRNGIGTGQFYAWEKHARQGALAALRNGKRGRKESRKTGSRQIILLWFILLVPISLSMLLGFSDRL